MNRLVSSSGRLLLIGCNSSRATACTRPTLWNYRHQRLASSDTDFKPSEELAKERYDLRANEDIDKKRARLLYQSRKRGMLENGVILASFANKYLTKFDAEHLDQYDRLINLPTNDWDIYYWATKTKPTPPEFETPVLAMLREHLTNKVSSEKEGKPSDSVLGKTKLDDIIMPAAKKQYELDIDPSEVDLTNYKQELFDHRMKDYKYSSIQLMTQWRKRFFERRLRRTLASPTSIKILGRTYKKVFTQKVEDKSIASEIVEPTNMIDSQYERAMKHHNFMQHLLSSNLTNDAQDYDDEAEAWANMIWHRNYGINDDKIAPSRSHNCPKCRSRLHCCDSGLRGYVPKEIFVSIGVNESLTPGDLMCQTCKFSTTYGAKLSHEMSRENYEDFLRQLSREKSALIVLLVDLTDFPGSIWEGLVDLVGQDKLFLVVGNKLDLLPYDGSKLIERVSYAFRKNLSRLRPGHKNLRISDSMVISARTGYGVEGLVTRILDQMDKNQRDVYLVGSNNTGKSTLFSALLQSDLSAKRTGDILSRVSKYELPGTNTSMMKFPIDLAEGWEVELKRRRTVRTERNTAERTLALRVTSERRQELMPHMSALINRFDYLPSANTSKLAEVPSAYQNLTTPLRPRFTEDHPLATVEDGEPMSADRDAFKENAFFHHTPSASTPDQLHDLLTMDERLEVFPNETIIPRKYTLRPHQSIFIAGMARLDLLTSTSTVMFTIFASRYLPVHVIQTRQADKFYNQFLGSPYLGVPFGTEARLAAWPDLSSSEEDFHIRSKSSGMGTADIVLSSVGWTLISLGVDQECKVRAYTPEGRGIFLRDPPLLVKASLYSTGKKIRDTPVFENSNYQITSSQI